MPKLLIIFLFLSLSSCSQKPTFEQITGKTMGTSFTIKSSQQINQIQIEQRLEQINQIFSNWNANSELSKVNKQPVNKAILLSDELSQVLAKSINIHKQTNGFFDTGLGKLIDVWGFGVAKVDKKPSRNIIAKALKNSSISQAVLNNQQFIKHADIQLNLSAIAKGYAVDEIAKLLSNQGVERFMVEIGGEIKVKGSWIIGIETPTNQLPIKIELTDKSIATSGNYRNYFIWEGRRYAHILNPKTGLPINSDLFSVSVIHQSNLSADAYATAMMAMGSEKAQQFAKRLGLKVVLILNNTDTQNIIKLGL
jgi:thiamine biosynthesis lipoprotein